MMVYDTPAFSVVALKKSGIAKTNPKAVAGFVRATLRSIQDTLKSPETAIDALMKRGVLRWDRGRPARIVTLAPQALVCGQNAAVPRL